MCDSVVQLGVFCFQFINLFPIVVLCLLFVVSPCKVKNPVLQLLDFRLKFCSIRLSTLDWSGLGLICDFACFGKRCGKPSSDVNQLFVYLLLDFSNAILVDRILCTESEVNLSLTSHWVDFVDLGLEGRNLLLLVFNYVGLKRRVSVIPEWHTIYWF